MTRPDKEIGKIIAAPHPPTSFSYRVKNISREPGKSFGNAIGL